MSDLRRPQRAAAGEDVIFSRLLKGRGRGQVSGTAAPFLLSHVPVGPTQGGIQMYQVPGVPTFIPMTLAGITWVALKGSADQINGKTAVTSCSMRDIGKRLLNGDVRPFDVLASRLGTILQTKSCTPAQTAAQRLFHLSSFSSSC